MFDEVNTRFSIGGRINYTTERFEYLDDKALDIVPENYKHMFTAVKDFRLDISSSEIRARESGSPK